MPELSDQQLKDRVQKLENLLRVINGAFVTVYDLLLYFIIVWNMFDNNDFMEQAREERIVALETENAMLYLKLAQVNKCKFAEAVS